MKDTEWNSFLEWIYRVHNITKDWTPNRTSIELWKEYESGHSNIEGTTRNSSRSDKEQGAERTSKKSNRPTS